MKKFKELNEYAEDVEYSNKKFHNHPSKFDLEIREILNDYDKLEAQNKDMLEILINLIRKNLIDDVSEDSEICTSIEKYTGKNLEEILK